MSQTGDGGFGVLNRTNVCTQQPSQLQSPYINSNSLTNILKLIFHIILTSIAAKYFHSTIQLVSYFYYPDSNALCIPPKAGWYGTECDTIIYNETDN